MKMLSRSLAAILLASAGFAAAPAIAQKTEATKPVKLSKPVQAALAEAQKLQAAGDHPGALAKVAEAEAFPSPTAEDQYMTAAVKLNSGITTKDNKIVEDALTRMLASGRVSAADQPKFLRNVGQLALERKDYNAATKAFEQIVAQNPNDNDALVALGELYFAQKVNGKAVETINRAIASAKASGTTVPEAWYRRVLGIAYDGKVAGAVQPAALALVKAYPNAVNWRDAVLITRDSFPQLDEQTTLDFLRLQAATGSLNGERDFVEYADTALGRGLPGEAQYALNEGIAKKMVSPTKPLISEMMKSANSKIPADKASLPGIEKDAKTNPKLALGTGDAYYGYGDFAKAAALYKQAVGGAGVDPSTVNLRLGAALARSGDKAGAATVLGQVKGGAREALAQYWMAYAGA
ncbi:tetratricopeptide repeat protein [Polymorphobacter fuscus]|uniref:Tetratricopeptide repeat protein n=1 Tax=Sandarakinorhabdus fusca TaxID=1439888 RepID=A0A7C9GTR2_9SPHN|nr:tetratricopeptide repeat protein [Polymorphobacter fuscus]KAB7648725.1 tetratricopeptide repeat protein [Polymorphobacter fuscus]MQT16289.1 tetratricopeptide repeat protein [Polymorphobacter fuscus]NJC07426.1 tetratricopeptide (TPR) repeat protein [Polymorphobacter fuscus]